MNPSYQANQKRNRPQKGDRIAVEPIRRLEDIDSIRKLLSDFPRDHLMFVMGVNNGLRIGDLLKLKVGEIRYLREGDTLSIREQKTGKANVLMVNKAVYKALKGYLDALNPSDDDYLFKSRKGYNNPITVSNANLLVKKWTKAINLQGNYGTHSLRKTFGYIQRTKFGVGFEILAKRFNHSNPAVTMRYLGIEDKEVNQILLNAI